MFERLTDRARTVMALANQEAQRFNHEYIGTEHILLGLVKEGSGVGAKVLKNFDIDLRKVRLEVEKLVNSGPEMVTIGKLPQTLPAKKVIQYAIEEARNLNHNYVGTEHLLLGLLQVRDGIAAQVLVNLGVHLEKARQEVHSILKDPRTAEETAWPAPSTGPGMEALTDRARRILALANEEASRLNNESIDAEHILLALLKEGLVGADMLKLPHAPATRKVLEDAIEEARSLNDNCVRSEHLLLAMLREPGAAAVLTGLGLDLERARSLVLAMLARSGPGRQPSRGPQP